MNPATPVTRLELIRSPLHEVAAPSICHANDILQATCSTACATLLLAPVSLLTRASPLGIGTKHFEVETLYGGHRSVQ